jgi:type II secretory pathway pseudopilin PulG
MVEMIIVIVIFGIVASVGVLILGRSFDSYQLTREVTNVDWHGRVALERLTRELREVRSATAADLGFTATPATELKFIDGAGNSACFYLSGGRLMRSADGPAGTCGTTSPQPLADSVSGLNFYFYQRDGSNATLATNVYYIAVSFTVTTGQVTEPYRVSVQPRRF